MEIKRAMLVYNIFWPTLKFVEINTLICFSKTVEKTPTKIFTNIAINQHKFCDVKVLLTQKHIGISRILQKKEKIRTRTKERVDRLLCIHWSRFINVESRNRLINELNTMNFIETETETIGNLIVAFEMSKV